MQTRCAPRIKEESQAAFPLHIVEEELSRFPSKGWPTMIHKVCEVEPTGYSMCCRTMKVVAFITAPHRSDYDIDILTKEKVDSGLFFQRGFYLFDADA
jgi:hypothetical protein